MTGLCLFRRSATILILLASSLFRLASGSGPVLPDATLTGEGILGLAGTSVCQEETHVLSNPCTGFESALLNAQFSTVPLDGYLCQYVRVSGPDVGVECPIIGAQVLTLVPPPSCIAALSVFDPAATWLEWPARPCASSYDVIRGALPGPSVSAGAVDLGAVTCFVNDLIAPPGPTASTETGPLDADTPLPGQAFFYLVRATLQPSGQVTPYGFSAAGEIEAPKSGDCAL